MKNYSDEELYLDLKHQNKDAVKFIYKNYKPMAMQFILKNSGSNEDARDVFQEAVIALWQNIQNRSFVLSSNTKMSTYFMQIIKYQWLNRLKKSKVAQSSIVQIETRIETTVENEGLRNLQSIDEARFIRNKLNQINENCRKILRLYYFEKLSLEEIADIFQVQKNSITNQKYRCLKRLKELF